MSEVEDTKNLQFTTPDFIKAKYYKTSAVRTRLNNAYKIRSIQPGQFVLLTGSPLIAALVDKGIDIQDDKSRVEAIKQMSDIEKVALAQEIAGNSNLADTARQIACKGVISLKLVDKSPEETTEEEISVDLIPDEDLEEIVAGIMKISATEDEIKEVYTFQDFSKEETGRSDTDTPISEDIQQETSRDTVSSGGSES